MQRACKKPFDCTGVSLRYINNAFCRALSVNGQWVINYWLCFAINSKYEDANHKIIYFFGWKWFQNKSF